MGPPSTWTFLTNHAAVLIQLAADPTLTLRQLSDRIGITERAVSRIVGDLSDDGYLVVHKVGRRNTYVVQMDAPLRRSEGRHVPVGALLRLILGDEPDAIVAA